MKQDNPKLRLQNLLCLGNVINALVDRQNGKERHVPFRDSKVRHDICIGLW
jgi:hypothetical protein